MPTTAYPEQRSTVSLDRAVPHKLFPRESIVQSRHGRGTIARRVRTTDTLYAVRMDYDRKGRVIRYLWGRELILLRAAAAAAAAAAFLAGIVGAVPAHADPGWGPGNPPPIPGSQMSESWPCGWSFGPVQMSQDTVQTWRWKPCGKT